MTPAIGPQPPTATAARRGHAMIWQRRHPVEALERPRRHRPSILPVAVRGPVIVSPRDSRDVTFAPTVYTARMDAGPLLGEVERRLRELEVGGTTILVASLADVIRSKRSARRPRDLAGSKFWRGLLKRSRKRTPRSRRARLAAVTLESERGLVAMIRRRLALPPARRTNFLRKRVAVGRSAL